MHLNCKNLISVFTILVLFSSCSLFHEDMTAVEADLAKKDFSAAIMKLDDMDSAYSKKISSKAHVQYAVSILKNIEQDKRSRYITVKDILEKAVQLDPKNQEAKTYYLMVLKLSKNA